MFVLNRHWAFLKGLLHHLPLIVFLELNELIVLIRVCYLER